MAFARGTSPFSPKCKRALPAVRLSVVVVTVVVVFVVVAVVVVGVVVVVGAIVVVWHGPGQAFTDSVPPLVETECPELAESM